MLLKMKPQASLEVPTDDLFRNRLDNPIDRRHELADLIDWERFDTAKGRPHDGYTLKEALQQA